MKIQPRDLWSILLKGYRILKKYSILLTLILTSLLVVNACTQSNISQRQLEVQVVDQRPWIGGPEIKVEMNNGDSHFGLQFEFKNSGKTPTTGLHIVGDIHDN